MGKTVESGSGASNMSDSAAQMDLNEAFRSGGRSVEFLDEINKASIVMLAEAGIVPHALASRIARGIAAVLEQEHRSPPHSADYLDYEPRLAAFVGPDASRLHTGRSRQDIASTIARMNLRDGVLRLVEMVVEVRERLLALASHHTETVIPAYTHGVQAQPTTFAHYLHALACAFARETERLQQAYTRINRNPLGTAALATSSFPIDRQRLAVLLGFEGLVENAYDANHWAPVDSALDVAAAVAIIAVQIGQFAQDMHAPYAGAEPWLVLRTGELTGVSSIMPQKRNPAALEQLRAQSSIMLGDMHTVFLMAHNIRTGMFDYRSYDPVPCERPLQVLNLMEQVIGGIVADRERALAEIEADYSTMTEIADVLAQKADVPFRIGHQFASRLTDYGRERRLKPAEISYAQAARIYETEANGAFPLSEAQFREALSPEHMVFGRRGRGGPQLDEMNRMIAEEYERVGKDGAWHSERVARLSAAEASLDTAFAALGQG